MKKTALTGGFFRKRMKATCKLQSYEPEQMLANLRRSKLTIGYHKAVQM